ncbi:MAG: protease [Mycobacterium sp.]|nr:protease [Mycobacterium sp.]
MKHVRAAVTALGLTLSLGVCAAPAASATEPVGNLTLDVKSLVTFRVQEVTLTCEPTGGDHPDAEAACADLIAANGDISAIPPVSASCLAYSPVAVAAVGTWAGQSDGYAGTFASWCAADAATGGHVFNFNR